MKKFNIYIFLIFFLSILFSCNKKSPVLSQEDLQIIKSVNQLKILETDDRTKALELLNEAIKKKPYIWDFYNSKLFIYFVNVNKAYTREEYIKNCLSCYEEYCKNAKTSLTTFQNYNYGFFLNLDGQEEEGNKYLEKAYNSLRTIKKAPDSGSKECKEMEDALMAGFLLGKVDDTNISNYENLFKNNTEVYSVIQIMFSSITPESFYEQLGMISIE